MSDELKYDEVQVHTPKKLNAPHHAIKTIRKLYMNQLHSADWPLHKIIPCST